MLELIKDLYWSLKIRWAGTGKGKKRSYLLGPNFLVMDSISHQSPDYLFWLVPREAKLVHHLNLIGSRISNGWLRIIGSRNGLTINGRRLKPTLTLDQKWGYRVSPSYMIELVSKQKVGQNRYPGAYLVEVIGTTPHFIPNEWKEQGKILFWGTVLEFISEGTPHVLVGYVKWNGEKWERGYDRFPKFERCLDDTYPAAYLS